MPEETKEEPVEEYDGTYVCFICSESVRGRDALQCSQCQSNPFHRACVAKYPGWAESCATCGGQTIEDWSLKSTSSAAPIDMIDLRSGSEGLGRRKDDVGNLAARVHVLEEERSRAAEAATREEETRKSYEEDRVKQQADRRIPVLEEEVAALTKEVSQSEVRAKLQKRDRTEVGGKDPACELPSKKACVDRRASGASEQGASSNPDLPTAYEQNDVSELVGRLRGNDSGLVEPDLTCRYVGGGLTLNTTLTTLDLAYRGLGEADGQAIGKAMDVNTTLTKLNLSSNLLGEGAGRAIGEALDVNTTLTQLNLIASALGGARAEAISKKCPHNRKKRICRECGGSSICEHNRQRSSCKSCGGSSICEHNRIRSRCKSCGSSICEHNRQRSSCKSCVGSSICHHMRIKYRCKDCAA